jgi:hypothetical protein
MNMQEIRGLARQYGIKPSHMSKTHLVRAIQQSEKNFDCYATATDGYCDQVNCLWRTDCFQSAKRTQH